MIRKAKEAPSVKLEKLETMIEFGEAVRNLTETIKALNCEDHLRNPQLLKDLTEKLPPSVRLEWSIQKSESSLVDFTSRIENRMDAACELCPLKMSEEKKKKESILLTPEEDQKKEIPKKEKKCLFCSTNGHRVGECRSFQKENLSDRLKFIRVKKLCYGCLNFGHSTRECKSKKVCGIDGCQFNHHRLIHEEKEEQSLRKTQDGHVGKSAVLLTTPVLFQVLPVILQGPNGTVSTYALLDSGSSFTLVDEEMSRNLGLEGNKDSIHFSTVSNAQQSVPSKKVTLGIIHIYNGKLFKLDDVRTFPELRLGGGTLNERDLEKWKYLKGIPIQPYTDVQPKLLIGLAHSSLMEPLKTVRGKNGPTAVETRLGWTLYGKFSNPVGSENVYSVHHLQHESNQSLHELVKDFFKLEEIGIENPKKLKSKAEARAEELAMQTLKRVEQGSRWEIGLLWKADSIQLPESKNQALRRLHSMEKKMDADADFGAKYSRNMEHYLKKGYIREFSIEEGSFESPRKWYLPHFAVAKPHKPGKIRLVFDAAAVSHGTSLNQELLTGPDILAPLSSVISKFRQRKIAFTADIREMFHQVKMKEEDQNSQRLLWRGMERSAQPKEYAMAVMTFGSTCSPYCAQYVKNTNAQRFIEESPRAVEAIVSRHYVDDYLDSTDTVEEAEELFKEVSRIQVDGGFELCNWTSNSPELIQKIPISLRAETQKNISATKTSFWTERILGLHWNPGSDCFFFTSDMKKVKKEILDGRKPTKRQALSLIMSLFDPLGMVAHFTIKRKIILQKVWRSGTGWDKEITESVFSHWLQWIEDLRKIESFDIPRCYSPLFTSSTNIHLHTFCDASEEAYAAVCFFRIQNEEGVDVSFAAAKAKVTPLKSISIPRAELEAAVTGVRLATSVAQWNAVNPSKKIFWTDSSTVYHWVRMDGGSLKPFVSHRVGEIQEATEPEDWRWIPTHLNVADDATRLESKVDFSKNSRWRNGVGFLKESEEEWPQFLTPKVEQEFLELKCALIGNVTQRSSLIEINRFSNWQRLIRTTAYVLRSLTWKNKMKLGPFLDPEELRQAEQRWWKWSQGNSFHMEIELLKCEKPLPKTSKIFKLSPFLDHSGILRMKSRVQSNVGTFEANPVILDPKEAFTRLLS